MKRHFLVYFSLSQEFKLNDIVEHGENSECLLFLHIFLNTIVTTVQYTESKWNFVGKSDM